MKRGATRPLAAPRAGLLLPLALLGAGLLAAPVASGETSAEELKAAFVYRFTLLVTWPAEAFTSPAAPLSLCILGEDPFDGALEPAVRGRRSQGRPLAVERVQRARALRGCHVLYVGPEEARGLEAILRALDGAPTLTVGETAEFAERGGIIAMRESERRILFEINRGAAERAGLRISSKLLQLAKAIH